MWSHLFACASGAGAPAQQRKPPAGAAGGAPRSAYNRNISGAQPANGVNGIMGGVNGASGLLQNVHDSTLNKRCFKEEAASHGTPALEGEYVKLPKELAEFAHLINHWLVIWKGLYLGKSRVNAAALHWFSSSKRKLHIVECPIGAPY
eukprot:422244-Pelagomonas_calceolata.AAC.1